MTFRELELFLVVADERSFVKAARKLFISQPAVTQQIKKIENELGFSLLYRDRHTVELTAQGEIMQNAARSILYTYNHAIADALRNSTSEQSLSIGYLGQMNLTLLPEIMKSFQLRYPNFSVLASRVRPTQISALLEQGLLPPATAFWFLQKKTVPIICVQPSGCWSRYRSAAILSWATTLIMLLFN